MRISPKGVEVHVFTRNNLLEFIGRRVSRGTKLCELKDMFYPTPVSQIAEMIQKLRKEKIIKRNRNGRISLAKKRG